MIHIFLIVMIFLAGCISVGEPQQFKQKCVEINDPDFHAPPFDSNESDDHYMYGHGEGDPDTNRNKTYISCNKTDCTFEIVPWESRIGTPSCYIMYAKRV